MKEYKRINEIYVGNASDNITKGCLVLEGGAFRGVYTSGVLDCLMQNDINISDVIGVSAGALNGANYVSGNIGRSAICNLRHRHDPKWVGYKALVKNKGIIGFDFAFGEFNKEIPFNQERFLQGKQNLYVVATNLQTGLNEYFTNRDECVFDAIRASASMPFVSIPVNINGKPYLDGGCQFKIPIRWALKNEFEKIVFIGTRNREYRKTFNHKLTKTVIKKSVYYRYPYFLKSLYNYNKYYNEDCDLLDELENNGKIFRISPSKPITISRLEGNMDKLGELYWLGYNDCLDRLVELRKYLGLK